jgi:hypothetical protein
VPFAWKNKRLVPPLRQQIAAALGRRRGHAKGGDRHGRSWVGLLHLGLHHPADSAGGIGEHPTEEGVETHDVGDGVEDGDVLGADVG